MTATMAPDLTCAPFLSPFPLLCGYRPGHQLSKNARAWLAQERMRDVLRRQLARVKEELYGALRDVREREQRREERTERALELLSQRLRHARHAERRFLTVSRRAAQRLEHEAQETARSTRLLEELRFRHDVGWMVREYGQHLKQRIRGQVRQWAAMVDAGEE